MPLFTEGRFKAKSCFYDTTKPNLVTIDQPFSHAWSTFNQHLLSVF